MKKKSEKKQNVEIMVPGTINSKGESREKCGQCVLCERVFG